ncbi:hypothetical protein FACS189472_16500 [Alphaproteobacteria bacterium]|nr:hypothetical protein FACS189472_16500 [Alphaproteobacteria bacterium]
MCMPIGSGGEGVDKGKGKEKGINIEVRKKGREKTGWWYNQIQTIKTETVVGVHIRC